MAFRPRQGAHTDKAGRGAAHAHDELFARGSSSYCGVVTVCTLLHVEQAVPVQARTR
jgi:hypothetical protein